MSLRLRPRVRLPRLPRQPVLRIGLAILGLLLLVGSGLALRLGTAHAAGSTDTTCTSASYKSDITTWAGSGAITFDCASAADIDVTTGAGGPGTVTVGAGQSLSITSTGAGVTLDGKTTTQLFVVSGTISSSKLTLDHLTLTDGAAASGGAINNTGTVIITNSTFSGNSATADGGAIYNVRGKVTITDSTFSGNAGGAIFNGQLGEVEISSSTFSGNSTSSSGGAIFNLDIVDITSSTFSGNSATAEGGAIYNGGQGTTTITGSTLSGNSGGRGGAITNDGALTMGSSIIANSPSGGNCEGQVTGDQGYNLTDSAGDCVVSAGSDITGKNPQLGPLQYNVGPTQTMALLSNSPAIDVIPTSSGRCAAQDQRGLPRPDDGESACDIGAFEQGPATYTVNVCSGGANGTLVSTSGPVLNLDTALADAQTNGGGTITFSCSGVIVLDQTLSISATTPLIIDGASHSVGLTGRNHLKDIAVQTGATVTLNALSIDGGSGGLTGGGIQNAGTLTLTNSTVSASSAVDGGGIANTGTLTVSHSTIAANTAAQDGGGIWNANGGTLTLTNSTVANNTASNDGGGIFTVSGGTLNLTSSTVASNAASGTSSLGGGLFIASGGVETTTGSIVAGNTVRPTALPSNCSGTVTDRGYNLESGANCGFSTANHSLQNTDPKLAAALAENGGPTRTLALQVGSPAIDQIPQISCPTTDDQRGVTRPDNTELACDIGAYEYEDVPAVITSAAADTVSVGVPFSFPVTTSGSPTPSLQLSGDLPSGVTFVDNGDGTATLAGETVASGAYALTVTASNGVGAPATQAFSLTVTGTSPVITSAAADTVSIGAQFSFTVTARGNPTPNLRLSGDIPSGVSFTYNGDGTGVMSGMVQTSGTYEWFVTAFNGVAPDATQLFTLTVTAASPVITSADSATTSIATSFSFTFTTTGDPTPFLSLSGDLPSGISFTNNGDGTATLAGATLANGSYPLTVTAVNGVEPPATQAFTLTVTGAVPAITSADSASTSVGAPFSFTFTTTGDPTPSLSLLEGPFSGPPPSGITFTDNGDGTATLAGVAATGTIGSYTLFVQAEDNTSAPPAFQIFTLTVTGMSPAITSANAASTGMRVPFRFPVTTSGDPTPSLSILGPLPIGVTFTDNGDGTGLLTGEAAAGTSGLYALSVTATNGVDPAATQNVLLTVTTASAAPAITSSAAGTETFGVPFSVTVTTDGYPAPALSRTGTLPAGVTFVDNGDGTATLAGTPSAAAAGVYSLAFKAKNALGTATQGFTLTIVKAPVFKAVTIPLGHVGSAYSLTLKTSAYFTAGLSVQGTLPAGLAFVDNGDGSATISGTPQAGSGGAYAITVVAANLFGSSSKAFTLKVNEAPAFTSASTASATVGQPFSVTVTTTGYPAPSLTKSGTLPKGLTYHAATHSIDGTPAAGSQGTYTLTFTAKNSTATVVQTFTLTVS